MQLEKQPFSSTPLPTAISLFSRMTIVLLCLVPPQLQAASVLAGEATILTIPVAEAPTLLAATGPDSDGDGIRNQDDLDDDNDGILDVDEGGLDVDGNGVPDAGSVDTDGDGTPDVLDLDSDNDGILDNLEARINRDDVKSLDLIPNGAIDIGFNVGANGVADLIETSPDSGVLLYALPDTDEDGVHDFRDTDSDGDGIYDVIEAGGFDNDSDGRLDGFYDADGKGVDDIVQASALPIFDTDGDGILDFRDVDSDGDTIPDRIEAGSIPSAPIDSDNDGAGDYRESDSDGDGTADNLEAGPNADAPRDSNGDGLADFRDPNTSNLDNVSASSDSSAQFGSEQALIDLTHGPDRDDDKIANQFDLDDDNDGIPDTVEGLIDVDGNGVADANSRDSDGDGTPDVNDLDSDNDGILDIREARADFTVVSLLDAGFNGAIDLEHSFGNNGLADIIETSPESGDINYTVLDTDGDGTPDYMDTDSDADGISDLLEAGGVDLDGDGRIDGFFDADTKGVDDLVQASALPVFDTDGDGIPDFRDTDSDADTLPDSVEAGDMPGQPTDSDGDGAADYREQDADNDSIPDNVEVGGNVLQPVDSDADGTPDYQDADSDNDGIPDDNGATNADNSGALPPVSEDVDGDGINNALDIDDDNDGLLDIVEGSGDTDGDRVLNQYDLDSDNDGLPDLVEAARFMATVAVLDVDGDGRVDAATGANGFADVLESTPDSSTSIFNVADSDSDGIPDFLDLDSDNDSIYDTSESNQLDEDVNGRVDLSLSIDAAGLASSTGRLPVDTDADGVADFRDLDSDNDSLSDLIEAGDIDIDSDGRIDGFSDADGDGADDAMQQAMSGAPDTDADRIPDYRDLDSDQDSLSDLLETQGAAIDLDNDGVIDNFVDSNSDGLDDNVAVLMVRLIDSDRDGLPDQVDLDSDGDGFSDLLEAGGIDNNNNGLVDRLEDADGDGIPNVVDVDITRGEDADSDGIDDMADVDFAGGTDTDGDGIVDSFDPDSDGNGFVGPLDDQGQGAVIQLPDHNGDGIPDFQESNVGPDGLDTGLKGSGFGCAISSRTANSSFDPSLVLLLLASVAGMMWRLRRRHVCHNTGKADMSNWRRGVVAVATISMITLTGCGSFGGGGQDQDFSSRVYIGAGLLASKVEPEIKTPDTGGGITLDETQSVGGTLQLGYDISSRFSVEGHVSDLGEATFKPSGDVGYQVGGISAIVYGFGEQGNRSRREGLMMFGRLGAGTMRNQGNGVEFKRVNDFHLLAGIGVEYGFASGLGLRAELVSHETDAKYAQMGLVYRFGEPGSAQKSEPKAVKEPTATVSATPTTPAPSSHAVDADNDGVLDAVDQCAGTGAGLPVSATGCEIFSGAIDGINFKSGSATLTEEASAVLATLAQTLEKYPEIRVAIEAHTDNQGSAESNLQLSKRRAVSVARNLVEHGIAGNRLKPQAFGESQPRETNATAAGRKLNRRVEFQVLE